jgi:hypothetical protein
VKSDAEQLLCTRSDKPTNLSNHYVLRSGSRPVGDVQLREATLVALFRLRGVAEASATYSYTFGDPS